MKSSKVVELYSTAAYKVLYAYTIPNSEAHEGLIKIGDATLHDSRSLDEIIRNSTKTGDYFYTSPEVEAAARKRIGEQVNTAGVKYELLWSILAVKPAKDEPERLTSFRDHEVHELLLRHGNKRVKPDSSGTAKEWFRIDLESLKNYVASLQNGTFISNGKNTPNKITLRHEQQEAVDFTKPIFNSSTLDNPNHVLWNAIMRFGKTLTSYELIKQSKDIKKVLILTHRPVVVNGWFEDHGKVFDSTVTPFSSARYGEKFEEIYKKDSYICFKSIQDMRGSLETMGNPIDEELTEFNRMDDESLEDNSSITGNLSEEFSESIGLELSKILEVESPDEVAGEIFTKNKEVFDTVWDLIIIDESHEGVLTELAAKVQSHLKSRNWLHLSGTPFNIQDDFDEDMVYTFDYIDERKALENFSREHPEEVNPYGNLPELKIFTYDISENFKNYSDPSKLYFNFNKFFETTNIVTDDGGKVLDSDFVDPKSVHKFFSLITKDRLYEDDDRLFPFQNVALKKEFAHTLWLMPTISACIALKKLLANHSYFNDFEIINATGDNFEGGDALETVKNAIAVNDYTITLSVGRLTTGVTIPEWTGVMLLSNIKSPMLYMQTIFRCKSSGILKDGRVKEAGYVFDFAPDRTLEMVAKATAKSASNSAVRELMAGNMDNFNEALEETLKFMPIYTPIVNEDGSRFQQYDIPKFMSKVYGNIGEEVFKNGFENNKIFNISMIRDSLTNPENNWNGLKNIVGGISGKSSSRVIEVASSGMSKEERAKAQKPKSRDNSPVENSEIDEARKKLQEERRVIGNIVGLLRAISVRVPLLVFAQDFDGAEPRITVDNFPDFIDDESWSEFMPRGFTKTGEDNSWEFVKPYFNGNIFEVSCLKVLDSVEEAMSHPPIERLPHIVRIFNTFKNPDKETVLTPWSVVNLQYAKTLGGLSWQDEYKGWYATDGNTYTLDEVIESPELGFAPRWVSNPLEWSDKTLDVGGDSPSNGSMGASNSVLESLDVTKTTDDFWATRFSTVADINSKTALYPLYAALSFYYNFSKSGILEHISEEALWSSIIENQVFVNCRTGYAAMIAKRVLSGNSSRVRVNSSVVDIINLRKHLLLVKLSKSELELVWKYIFDSSDYGNATDRSVRVLGMSDREDILELVRGVDSSGFTGIVGNPPYQISVKGNARSAAIYHQFDLVAMALAKYVSIVHPIRWVNAGWGEGIDEFRENSKNDVRFSYFYAYLNGNDLFPNVEIKGGLNIFLWDRDKTTKKLKYFLRGKETIRKNLSNDLDTIIIDDFGINLINDKITTKNPLSSIIAHRRYYGEAVMGPEPIKKAIEISQNNKEKVLLHYSPKGGGHATVKVNRDLVSKEVDDYKVFTLKTVVPFGYKDSKGSRGRIFIGGKGEISSDTFLKVGSFKSEEEAVNCLRYMKTIFAVFLLTMASPTHNSTRKNYVLIPNVDFKTGEIMDKPGVYLDFTKPETLDEQLAKIYELTEEEQELMSKDLKPWRDKVDVGADE